MFRAVSDQVSLAEAGWPPVVSKLPDEFARSDSLLDDPAFFTPFVPFFDLRVGRPSTPMETYRACPESRGIWVTIHGEL